MLSYDNVLGKVTISERFFTKLVHSVVCSSYGVCEMSKAGKNFIKQALGEKIKRNGVFVYAESGEVVVELHIIVAYGVNINAISNSIVEKVKYTIEKMSDIAVKRVVVHVDGIK